MSIPAPAIQVQGQGVVSADNLNSYVTGGGLLLANLRAFSGLTGMTVFMSGYTGQNDGGQGMFGWVLGTGTDDGGVSTIVPTGNTAGYIQLNRIFISQGWQPSINFDYGSSLQIQDSTLETVTLGMASIYDQRTKQRVFNLSFPRIQSNEAFVNALDM